MDSRNKLASLDMEAVLAEAAAPPGGAPRLLHHPGGCREASVVEEPQGGVHQGYALLVAGLDHHLVSRGAGGSRNV